VHRAGGAAAFLLLGYSLATMVQLVLLGGPPKTAVEAFGLLQQHPVEALLRLDLPTALVMPLYYVLFLALARALWQDDPGGAALGGVLVFAGLTLVLATPSSLSLLTLAARHAAAPAAAERAQLEAAGQAILAADMWHGTGAFVGGLLLQAGATWTCVVMLRSSAFPKSTAVVGIATHGLDFAHVALAPAFPTAGLVTMAAAGPLYLLWFPMVGTRLLRLALAPGRPAERA